MQTQAVKSGLALDLFAYHTTRLGTAEEHVLSEVQQTYRHQASVLPGLLQGGKDLYLLVDPAENRPGVEPASRLAHDTLAPLVRARFDESDAVGQRARRILENRAVDWVDGKEGTPLGDSNLTLVEAGTMGMRAHTKDEDRLIEASRMARDRRIADQQRRARERRRNRLILFGVGMVAMLAIIAALGSFAWGQSRIADEQETAAASIAVAATGEAVARKAAVANEQIAKDNEELALQSEATAVAERVAAQQRLVQRLALDAKNLTNTDLDKSLLISLAIGEVYSRSIESDASLIGRLTDDLHVVTTCVMPTDRGVRTRGRSSIQP